MGRNKPRFSSASLNHKWQNLLTPSPPKVENNKYMRYASEKRGRGQTLLSYRDSEPYKAYVHGQYIKHFNLKSKLLPITVSPSARVVPVEFM